MRCSLPSALVRRLPALLLGPALVLMAGSVAAEVDEQVAQARYTARPVAGDSLRQALSRATPIRSGGRVFHGYTDWRVDWRFWWFEQADGRCTVTRSRTTLSGRITLPELVGAGAQMQRQFQTYLQALSAHEQGHMDLGRAAARQIDQAILGLPAMASCAALERRANALGQRLLAQTVEREKAYDRNTWHGRTQGAWLPP